ncbi:hypothetical protein AB0K18_48750 [Nonomuraea sp. NPDC049421]|uniref:tetratricopeptide repeat protein n=1 Tax=Nonomuraea sp. NPDC049421 TaxID=3155275 RepID=UPI0034358E11
MEELWKLAGTPLLDSVARTAARYGEASRQPTGKRISAWKTGENVPSSFKELKPVLRALISMARARKGHPGGAQHLYSFEAWEALWSEAKESPVGHVKNIINTGILGLPIVSADPIELEVHPSIEIISAETNDNAPVLPLYVKRAHDHGLESIIDKSADHSSICVLVGGSSTGKTRACWEAVKSLGSHWRIWHPLTPSRHEALLNALRRKQISPYTVLWLNEIQFYLNPSPSNLGEEIAAELRELIKDPARGPVIILGTCWPEHWQTLTLRPDPTKPDLHSQARALLTGQHVLVPDEFLGEEIERLSREASRDRRLKEATAKGNRRVTQFLAGALELVNRYETLPIIARSLIHVMMDVRRLGYKGTISEEFLRSAVQGYMHEDVWAGVKRDWFKKAVKQSRKPCLGVSGPLRLRRVGAVGKPTYDLADYLDEIGRIVRREEFPPASFWTSSVKHLRDANGLLDLAYEAQIRGRLNYAALMYLQAANLGELEAILYVAEHRRAAGAIDEARKLFSHAADKGIEDAWLYLAQIEKDHGDEKAAARILGQVGDKALAARLAIYLTEPGQNKEHALRLLEQAFNLSPKKSLTDLDLSHDEGGLRDLLRQAWHSVEAMDEKFGALRVAAENLRNAEEERLEIEDDLIEEIKDDEESFAWISSHLLNQADNGDADALLLLAKAWRAVGDSGKAKQYMMIAINQGYADRVTGSNALAILADLEGSEEHPDLARQILCYGLEVDGSPASQWSVSIEE